MNKALTNGLPSLQFLYSLRKAILVDILKKGANAAPGPGEMWAMGLNRPITLGTFLVAVEKMIEAMASLCDFDTEPLTEGELNDLNEAAQPDRMY